MVTTPRYADCLCVQNESSENGDFIAIAGDSAEYGAESSNTGLQRLAVDDKSPLFARFSIPKNNISPKHTLAGWRRSYDRASLYRTSLLTGNITGNSVISEFQAR